MVNIEMKENVIFDPQTAISSWFEDGFFRMNLVEFQLVVEE